MSSRLFRRSRAISTDTDLDVFQVCAMMEDLQALSYVFISILFFISTITILMRIYVRGFTMRSFWWDDWLMTAMLFFNTVQQILAYYLFHHGAGLHMNEVTTNHPEWLHNLLKWNLVNQFWYTLLQFSIKLCFLLFYYRLTDRTGFRRWLWAILWFHAASTVVIVLIVGLQAVPLAAVYEPENYPNAARIPVSAILFVTYALTLTTDIFILILPLPIVFSLQMSAKRRMTVLAVVTTGGSAVLVCGLRGIVLVEAGTSPDFTFTLGKLLVMLNIELQVAIVAANMPSLKSFYTCWRQQMLGPGQAIGAESLDTRSRRLASKSLGDIELQSRQHASKFLDSGDHHGKLAHGFSRISIEENTRYFNDEMDSFESKGIADAGR